MRLLHGVIALGLVVVAVVFATAVRLVRQPPPAQVPRPGGILAAVAGAILLLALVWLRPLVPRREANQSPDAYWGDPTTRGRAVVLWAAVEGAGVVGALGYLVTGTAAPAAVAAIALILLLLIGPARLES